jgi:predicted kinase
MSARIVVVRGKHDSGKTTSINRAVQRLQADATSFRRLNRQSSRELVAVIEIQKVTVGIFSAGDTEEILTRWFAELLCYGCDVIVCACRSRGQTDTFIKRQRDEGHTLHRVEKDRALWEDREKEANDATAEQIVKKVGQAIAEVKGARREARR